MPTVCEALGWSLFADILFSSQICAVRQKNGPGGLSRLTGQGGRNRIRSPRSRTRGKANEGLAPDSLSQGPGAEGGPHLGLVQAELQPCRGPRLPEGTNRIKRGRGRGCLAF